MAIVRTLVSRTARTTAAAVRRAIIGGTIVAIGLLAIGASLASPEVAPAVLGVLLIACGIMQAVHALILHENALRRSELFGSIVSLVTGLLLTAWGDVVFPALAALLGISWVADGIVKLVTALRRGELPGRSALLFDAAVNLLIGSAIGLRWPLSGAWAVYVTVGLRLLSTGWSILFGHDAALHDATADSSEHHPDARLGLPPHSTVARMREQIDAYEERRWVGDRYWVSVLLITFFAIHVGRMNAEWNLVGLISPAIAVAGDVVFAIALTPSSCRSSWRADFCFVRWNGPRGCGESQATTRGARPDRANAWSDGGLAAACASP